MSELDSKKSRMERSRTLIKTTIGRLMKEGDNSSNMPDKISEATNTERPHKRLQAPEFEGQLTNLRTHLGSSARLTCRLEPSVEAVKITWLKNSAPVQLAERMYQSFDGVCARLVITIVEDNDFGCYECVAESPSGKSVTAGNLLLKGSLADSEFKVDSDCSIENFHKKDATEKPSLRELIKNIARDEKYAGMKETLKETLIQKLGAVRNRHNISETNLGISRKKSFHDSPPIQPKVKVESSLHRSATTVKQKLLEWCKIQVRGYKNVNITNFSSSWNDGMAFCALIHHFCPGAFDYNKLDPQNIQYNFQLAFDSAKKCANITPLLDVEDMVRMKNPDWKCVFMYVESMYRAFAINLASSSSSPSSSSSSRSSHD